jgi:ankyrin repeat protein
MPPPQLPLEILLMIARLLTDDEGELSLADFNSFLKVNRALYACLNRTLWQEAVEFEDIAEPVFKHLIRTNDIARLKFFLELGADIETDLLDFIIDGSDDWDSRNTALKVAVVLDDVPMARLLLEHGAGLVQYDKDGEPGYSAIHAARSAEMVQLLLDNHADPEQEVDEFRPLHFYASRDNIEAMQAVLRNGVEANPVSGTPPHTPLLYAAQQNIEAVKLLLEHGADARMWGCGSDTPFHSAAKAGKADVLRLLLERWPEGTREKGARGTMPLHSAAEEGETDVVKLLLEHWPEGTREKDWDGNTPLELAASSGTIDVVRLLLEHWPEGARVKSHWGYTPLHLAARMGEIKVVRLLVESWPEGPRQKDANGNTPLHMAAYYGKTEAMRLLVEIWPEGKETLNENGQTPLLVLEEHVHLRYLKPNKREEIITLLGGMYRDK